VRETFAPAIRRSGLVILASLSALVVSGFAPDQSLSVRDFGAIGDGKSHPACKTLGLSSLTELRAVQKGRYSVATGCDDEMDWLAAAAAAAAGYDLVYPRGIFLNNHAINLPEAPDTPGGKEPSRSISIFGASHETTILRWPHDLGPGQWAIACEGRTRPGAHCAGIVRNVTLMGPGDHVAVGTPPAQMDGFAWGARRQVNDLYIAGFNKCFSIVGDQTSIDQLQTNRCAFGIYFEKPNPILFGDLVFTKTIINNSAIAGIAVAPEASVNEVTWIGLVVAGAPWGILKETNGKNFQAQVTHGATFISTQWEHIGNGLIGDDAGGDDRKAIDYNTRWLQTEYTHDERFRLPGSSYDGVINLLQSYQTVYDGLREPSQWEPGRLGIFNIRHATQTKVIGDLPTLQHLAAAKHLPVSAYGSDSLTFEIPGQPSAPIAAASRE
jgi:hypothetical protein